MWLSVALIDGKKLVRSRLELAGLEREHGAVDAGRSTRDCCGPSARLTRFIARLPLSQGRLRRILHLLLDGAEDRVAALVLHLDAHRVAEAQERRLRRAVSMVSIMRISAMQE